MTPPLSISMVTTGFIGLVPVSYTHLGGTIGVELGNLGFDYNTGRMYCVDYTNGGLGIIDLDTGAVDLLGTYSGDIGGPAITPAMLSLIHILFSTSAPIMVVALLVIGWRCV